jgi:hypothetical protein
VLGRYLVIVFPTLEGVVSWLRLYSHEASLDELVAGLEIVRVRTPLMSREMILRIPAVSSYAADRAARLSRLVGGSIYTGTAKHFVKYRDDRSPYGYDAVEIGALPAGAELMVHGDDFTQTYAREGDISLARLLFRLSLRRVPGAQRLSPDDRADLVLAVARGLGDGVIRYLWRNKVDGEVGLVSPKNRTATADNATFAGDPSYLLMRVHNLPERILDLFLGTPGIDVFRPVSENVAVAVGWAHPVELASVASLLPNDTYHVFWPGDRVDLVAGPLELSRLADLTRIDLELEGVREPRDGAVVAPDPVGVSLRLAPASGLARRVSATLVPLSHTTQFKRLVYVLPPAALRGLRVAVTDRGIVVVASHDLDVIPLGTLLTEMAPGILVPIGMEVVPRVSPEVLAQALGHGSGVLTVFTPDAPPFQLPEGKLAPLERRSVAKLESETVEVREVSLAPPGDPNVVNDPLGRFALWGFPEPEQKQLGE